MLDFVQLKSRIKLNFTKSILKLSFVIIECSLE